MATTAVPCRLGTVLLAHDGLDLLKRHVHGGIAVSADLPLL